jgi:hypothetical protein
MLVGYVEKLEVTNARGNVLTLQMEEDDGPYQVAEIDGLDPGKAALTSSRNAGADGEVFQSATRPARNIKIKLDLDPDFDAATYESARNELYRWFMPKAKVKQRYFLSSGLYVDIEGIVESNDSPIFDDDPDVTVSLMCYDVDFVDPRIVTRSGLTVASSVNTEIDYPGTVDAGTVLTLHVNRALSDFSIYNIDETGSIQQLNFSGTLLNGDTLVISSLDGNKGVTLTRAGVSSSYLYGRTSQSSWIKMVEGLNQFRVYAVGDPIPYDLEYRVRYGGL